MLKHVDRGRLTAVIEILRYDEEDDGVYEEEVTIPIRLEVCSTCCGRGKIVNPSVDGDGWTRHDFDEDPDFEEAYFRGDYDIRCTTCYGANVEGVPDEGRMNPEQKAAWATYCQNQHDRHMSYLESQAEKRFGA